MSALMDGNSSHSGLYLPTDSSDCATLQFRNDVHKGPGHVPTHTRLRGYHCTTAFISYCLVGRSDLQRPDGILKVVQINMLIITVGSVGHEKYVVDQGQIDWQGLEKSPEDLD